MTRRGASGRVVSAPPLPPRVPRTSWRAVAPYVSRWHAVYDWATDVLWAADELPVTTPNPRVMKRRGAWVADIDDNEEAYERGAPVEDMNVPRGPKQTEGGRRRVLVRAYMWTVDEVAGSVYEPQWITMGVGSTACMASDAFARWVRRYAYAMDQGIASRRLVATAIEVTWWTARESSDYV